MVLIIVSFFWVASEIILTRVKHSTENNSVDRGSLKTLWRTIIASVTIGIFSGFQNIGRINSHLFYWLGIICIIVGLVIRWTAILQLKQMFTVDVAIGSQQRIIKNGIYNYIRHPAYAGSLLSFLGLGIAFSNILSIAIIFIPVCIAFLHRIKIEEKALVEAFGDEYLQYCRMTKRLIPKIY